MTTISRFGLVKLCVFALAGLLPGLAAPAEGIDLHRMWDDRCFVCHGHAGEFARKWLRVSDEELQGRHHTHDLKKFLRNHYLASAEVDSVYGMLLAQAKSQARFKHACSGCHGTAAAFVRRSLEFRGSTLYSRALGQPVQDFLGHHRDLSQSDIEFFTKLLERVAREVFRP